jgi:leucyl aminopeptidase
MKRLALLFLLMALFLSGRAQHLFEHDYPVVQQEDARIRHLMDQVSQDSLKSTINHMQSYLTRRWDTRMVYEVQDWLYETYHGMGIDSVGLHDFQFIYHDTLRETSDNVIAIQRGLVYPDEYVVCGAHYDSYNHVTPGNPDSVYAPGADDNASGTSGILETARLLSQCKFERSIMYCGWAAEEIGLIGSAAYAKDCADRRLDIVGYFNLDMIGYLEEGREMQMHLMYVNRDSTFANYIYQFCETYDSALIVKQGWISGGDSDYSSFNRNGYAAVHLFEHTHHYSPFIHTTDDVLGISVNNMDQAQRFTQIHLGLVATLAGLMDTSVDETDPEELTVYPNPVSGLLTVKGVQMREVSVYNLMGQRVAKETCHEDEIRLDVSSLAAGVYVLRVLDDAMQVHSHRVIIY